jgi:hypothetical protein
MAGMENEQTTNDDLNDHAVERAQRSDAERISEECDALKAMLLEKNKAYGSSALSPVRIFAKSDTVEQIRVRIDDKLSRLIHGSAAGEDVVKDLLGYLILLRIATKEQWDKRVHVAASPEVIDEVLAAENRAGFLYTDELGVVRQFPNPSTEEPREDVGFALTDAEPEKRPIGWVHVSGAAWFPNPSAEEPREDVGFALTDAEAAEAERAVDADWGGAVRRKLGVARGMLEEVLEVEEQQDYCDHDLIRKLKETLVATADSSPTPQSDAMARLVQQRDALWALLDNIDTLDDSCRDNDRTFRNMVRRWQRTRFDIFNPDDAKPEPGLRAPHAAMQDTLEKMRGRLALLRERILPLQRDSDALHAAYEAAGISSLMNLAGHIRALKILVADRNDLKATLAATRRVLSEEASMRQREAEVATRKLAEAEAAIALMQSRAARKDDAAPGTNKGE